jgi:hypothetical protein
MDGCSLCRAAATDQTSPSFFLCEKCSPIYNVKYFYEFGKVRSAMAREKVLLPGLATSFSPPKVQQSGPGEIKTCLKPSLAPAPNARSAITAQLCAYRELQARRRWSEDEKRALVAETVVDVRTAAFGDGGEAATVLAYDSSNAAKANAGTNEVRRTCFMLIS